MMKKEKNTTAITAENALARLRALCAAAEQAEAPLRRKLGQWGLAARDVDEVIATLKRERYLDERRYARAFVHDKWAFNGWGRVKIAMQLRRNGVAAGVVEEALAQGIADDEYHDALRRLMLAKWKSLQGREPALARAALLRFAASRGYEAPLIMKMSEEITHIAADDEGFLDA